jgi:hypothetical protein
MESLIREKRVLDKEAKASLMAQFDQGAKEWPRQAWQEILSLEEAK